MIEEVAVFGGSPLTGVLCRPTGIRRPELPGVVLLTPGLLHRVGPNRLYVKIARALAGDGFNVLRFDLAGQGDSPPRTEHIPQERAAITDTQAAIDHLIDQSGCERVVLMGHCSGAILALMKAFNDERVVGVVSISPEGGDEGWIEYDRRRKEARYYANYYGRGALNDRGRWRRLLTGKADYASIARNVFRNVIWYRLSSLGYKFRSVTGSAARSAEERPEIAEFKAGMRSLAARRLPILLIHPDQSAGREMMRALLGDTLDGMRATGNLQLAIIAHSDHLFTPLAAQHDLIGVIRNWLREPGLVSPVLAATARESR